MANGIQFKRQPPPAVYLNPFTYALIAFDFTIWLFTLIGPLKTLYNMFFRKKTSAAFITDGKEPNALIVRQTADKDCMSTRVGDYQSPYHLMEASFEANLGRNAFGKRKYLGKEEVDVGGRKIPMQKFGETQWTTYMQGRKQYLELGQGLVTLGHKAQTTLLIYEDTCQEWMITMLGAWSQSVAVATSYATLGVQAVAVAANQTKALTILCNRNSVKLLLKMDLPHLKNIIYTDHYVTAEDAKKNIPEDGYKGNLRIVSFKAALEMGRNAVLNIPVQYPKPTDTAVIMYTSGSTGNPKGVVIKHSNLNAAMHMGRGLLIDNAGITQPDTSVAYLPLAHIFELVVQLSLVSLGWSVGYACPRTLSHRGAIRIDEATGTRHTEPSLTFAPGALQEFKPRIFAAVPKIYDTLKKGVEATVGGKGGLAGYLFQVAFWARSMAIAQGRDTPLFNLLFGKVAQNMGGRVKMMISGGGPIDGETMNFMRVTFMAQMGQGYGLTEVCCVATLQDVHDNRTSVVGYPSLTGEIKLISCDGELKDSEGKPYLATDTKHFGMDVIGRGEVCLRGAAVTQGYFEMEKATKEVFGADGWFKTGDVGILHPDGALQIVDRVKNLVKLKGGEYVAIEKMETCFNACRWANGAAGGVFVFADGTVDRPIAVLQLDPMQTKKWAKENNISYDTPAKFEEVCKHPHLATIVLNELNNAGKEAGNFSLNEKLSHVILVSGTGSDNDPTPTSPWTPFNQLLTASNKLNRKPLISTFMPQIENITK